MKLHDDIDFTTLNWVKQELDETLMQARQALEAYVEDPADSSLMRFCATYLHQVQGTLRMVELYGAAMVVEEMERVALALLEGVIKPQDDTYSVLMRGIVQLPDYLERLQSGHKDIPIVLLPLLNDLRACRGEKLLTESVLFAPDLTAPLPAHIAADQPPVSAAELKSQAGKLRVAFQVALLKWFRAEKANEHLDRLNAVLQRLLGLSREEETRRLWWITAAVLEAVQAGGLEASVAVKLLIGKVDREIKRLVDSGESDFKETPPRELTKNLLYYIAHSSIGGPRVDEVRQLYKLSTLLPSQKELDHAKGSISGHNRTLLDTVSKAIKEDLLRVKEALDIFLRAHDTDPAELLAQVDVLDRVGDTLGMLGLGVPRRVVLEQREIVEQIANKTHATDESTLLDVAGALLYVEASLDDHIDRLGASVTEDVGQDLSMELPKAEVRKILDALMNEAAVNIAQAKQDIVAFIESPWDHARMESIPRLLEEISGALRMLALSEPAQLMTGIIRFVEVELLRHRRVPTVEQMDHLADALASIEYYLEATQEQRGGREKILAVTRQSLQALGYWPVPDDDGGGRAPLDRPSPENTPPAMAKVSATPAPTGTLNVPSGTTVSLGERQVSAAPSDSFANSDLGMEGDNHYPSWGEHLPTTGSDSLRIPSESGDDLGTELPSMELTSDSDLDAFIANVGSEAKETRASAVVRTLTPKETPAPVEAAVDAGFQNLPSDDIDEEIREVFIEEVQEEINNLAAYLPLWQEDLQDFEKLKPIRRSFHTLKGSGRLVGALALGEFSWKIENMLNRVLDKSIEASPALVTLVQQAMDALPELLAGLRGQGSLKTNIGGMMAIADKLARGEIAWLESQPLTTSKAIVGESAPLETAMVADASDTSANEFDLGVNDAIDGSEITQQIATPEQVIAELTGDSDVESAWQAMGSLSSIDPVLFDILRSEVTTHLAIVDTFLADARAAPLPITEPLLRAVHTLNGAIAMVDIPVIGQVLAPLEGYVKRLRAGGAAIDTVGIQALEEASALVKLVIGALESAQPQLPNSDDLARRISLLRDALPEPELAHTLFGEVVASEPTSMPEPPLSTVQVQSAWQQDADFLSAVGAEPSASTDDDELLAALEALERAHPSQEAPTTNTTEFSSDAGVSADDLTAAWVRELEAQENSARRTEITSSPLEDTQSVPAMDSVQLKQTENTAEPQLPLAMQLQAAIFAPAPASELSDSDYQSLEQAAHLHRADADVKDVDETATPLPDLPQLPPIAEDPHPEGKLDLPDLDQDLLEIFVQEGTDILDHTDALIAGLRDAPQDRDRVSGLQRDLHTLKGGAHMAGLTPIGDLSHAMESLLEAISENRRSMDRSVVESLERGFDRLHEMVQRVARRQLIAMPLNAIARFEGLVSGHLPEPEAPAPADQLAQPIKSIAPAPVAKPISPPRPVRPPLRQTVVEEEDTARAPQEMIRVRSELLDSLVNYAGEVSIYRSRLEQQISTFRFNLVEFETTVSRLRDQLRKLEIETEAQILSRFQREADSTESTFDPLELDRFSQLQQLSRALAESVSDLVSIQGLLDDLTRQSESLLLQQSRVNSDLQEGLMRTRMVPFDSLVPSLRRTLRQAASELGKRAQIKVEGAQGEMDRNLLERMKAPFEHMLRNALAHGIESPEERLAIGKPAEGTVNIAVSREATEVVLRLSDDGRGMDRDAIRKKAIERGLMHADAKLSDRDLFSFVIETGFSTADKITQLSGRGVGMDVVHNEIKQLGGSLAIDSIPGKGTTFTIRLPFTLAVTQAILVRLGDYIYAIPMSSVLGVVRISKDDLDKRMALPNPTYTYAGEEFLIYELWQLLNVSPGRVIEEQQLPLLMTRTGDQRAAVRIDSVIGSREVVVKSVGPQISSVPGIFGATIMGDGSVVMILDLAPLVRRNAALRLRIESGEEVELPAPPPVMASLSMPKRQPLVMVVDDSITMRKVTTRVLERNEMDVVTAKDGLDAVEKLQEKIPDLMLLDIEMPRMDGYELATYMKNDPRLRMVPIIMISSRTGEKHRQRALEIGVERFLGKPYQEADLLQNVQETLKVNRVEP